MVAACMVRTVEKIFHVATLYLRAHPDMAEKIEFESGSMPSGSTISDAYTRIPKLYFYKIHEKVASGLKLSRVHADDITGVSERRSDKWVDFRTKKVRYRKGWIKLHAVIDVALRVNTDYFVTRSRVSDIVCMLISCLTGSDHVWMRTKT